MRLRYSAVDLLRFNEFASMEENEGLNGIELIQKYNKESPDIQKAFERLKKIIYEQ